MPSDPFICTHPIVHTGLPELTLHFLQFGCQKIRTGLLCSKGAAETHHWMYLKVPSLPGDLNITALLCDWNASLPVKHIYHIVVFGKCEGWEGGMVVEWGKGAETDCCYGYRSEAFVLAMCYSLREIREPLSLETGAWLFDFIIWLLEECIFLFLFQKFEMNLKEA